jgi:uncharacterized protein YndB with AHSA1/START domain
MTTTSSGGEPDHAAADREIVVCRTIGAPRELVFEAFTQVRHLSRWWGPEGFTTLKLGEGDIRCGIQAACAA